MKTTRKPRKNNRIVLASGLTSLALCLALSPARAAMLYYLPFDDGTTSNFVNYGSIGGTASAVAVNPLGAPVHSQRYYTNLYVNIPSGLPGTARSMTFPSSGNIGSRIDLPSSSTQFRLTTAGQQMTIAGWLKWDGPDTDGNSRQGIVSTEPSSQNTGWRFAILNTGRLAFDLGGVGDRNSTSATVVPIAPNDAFSGWTHVAVAYTRGGDPSLYINGTNVGLSASYYGAVAVTNSQTIRLGNVDGTYLPVNGRMDDVALWDANLSAGKIRSLVTVPALLSGYNAGAMNKLFALFDAANPASTVGIDKLTWRYSASLPAGHSAGDAWTGGERYYIQLNASGGGVFHKPSGTLISVY